MLMGIRDDGRTLMNLSGIPLHIGIRWVVGRGFVAPVEPVRVRHPRLATGQTRVSVGSQWLPP
jgi:hypothetical protein